MRLASSPVALGLFATGDIGDDDRGATGLCEVATTCAAGRGPSARPPSTRNSEPSTTTAKCRGASSSTAERRKRITPFTADISVVTRCFKWLCKCSRTALVLSTPRRSSDASMRPSSVIRCVVASDSLVNKGRQSFDTVVTSGGGAASAAAFAPFPLPVGGAAACGGAANFSSIVREYAMAFSTMGATYSSGVLGSSGGGAAAAAPFLGAGLPLVSFAPCFPWPTAGASFAASAPFGTTTRSTSASGSSGDIGSPLIPP
mmetsp:Transcript_11978/g.37288  ORF Transcript_11978/g.37288 Transcript_11978/m.37288 type:complete len:259 (+) Transcript_11978:892-1668(+)